MIDHDKAFAQFALYALIGGFATMMMEGGLLPLLGVALALIVLRKFFDAMP
jgi:hypothetical protein